MSDFSSLCEELTSFWDKKSLYISNGQGNIFYNEMVEKINDMDTDSLISKYQASTDTGEKSSLKEMVDFVISIKKSLSIRNRSSFPLHAQSAYNRFKSNSFYTQNKEEKLGISTSEQGIA